MGVVIERNVYYHIDINSEFSVDYGNYYRCIESIDNYFISDQLYHCVTYLNEGEKIEYVFPPYNRNNEQGSREFIL